MTCACIITIEGLMMIVSKGIVQAGRAVPYLSWHMTNLDDPYKQTFDNLHCSKQGVKSDLASLRSESDTQQRMVQQA